MKMSIQKVRAAAIMLALWALFLLSALVISWALDIDSRLSVSGEGNRILDAEAVACSGAEVALHPLVNPGSQNLKGQLGNGAKYEARLTGESGRLDVNWLVAGEDQQKLEILRRYLEKKGVDLNERDKMIDALLDWVELDVGLHRLNAPPESDDYHPAHSALTQVDELKKVAGWADFTSNPGWDDDLTVHTLKDGGNGRIDLTWASRDVLLALPGMTPHIVDRFLQLRQGPDGIDGTEDDVQFKSLDDALSLLGVNDPKTKQVFEALVTIKSSVYRVMSAGMSGNAKRTVQVVFKKNNTMVSIKSWKEF